MAAMKLWNTPRPVAWSPLLASFPPPVLILATSSSNSLPHLTATAFWWLAVVEWLDRCGGRRRRRQFIEKHLGQRASRTGLETGQAHFGPVQPRFAPRRFSINCWLAPLLHEGPWRHLLHGLDRSPCHTSFSIFCSGPWSFVPSHCGPWVIWSHVHLECWLVPGSMILS
jgi:hypothetical protein